MSRTFALVSILLFAACAPQTAPAPAIPVRIPGSDTLPIPLTELGARTYKGIEGGLYPGRSNSEPADHDAIGVAHRNAIRPLDVNGKISGSGRYVLMSVGARDVSAVWCSASSAPPCDGGSFTARAVSDPLVNHTSLVIVNGAFPTATIEMWTSPSSSNYNRIRDTRLSPLGLSENQVQAIWMQLDDSAVVFPLTASPADAASNLERLGSVIRALKQRYPNLQLLFLTTSHGSTDARQAYESGFIVKWTIESQIDALRGKAPNPYAGDLTPSGRIAPWVSWGPYTWTADQQPANAQKDAATLFDFFRSSPYTRCWFTVGPACN